MLDTNTTNTTRNHQHNTTTMSQLDVPHGSSPPATSRASTLADEDLRPENPKTDTSVPDTASRTSGGLDRDPEKLEAQAAAATDELSEDEYPSGYALLSVVVALILSIFLIALDMVRPHTTPREACRT